MMALETISGTTEGAEATMPLSLNLLTTASPDRWYSFTNETEAGRVLRFKSDSLITMLIEMFPYCSNDSFDATMWGSANSLSGVEFDVYPGQTVYFRVEAAIGGVGGEYVYHADLTIDAVGPDPDGDGVVEGIDNCPSFNPDQADLDFDGVGDACDVCPTGDNSLDADGDGVPDDCDACPGSPDFLDDDGDGVPNACDICIGDDKLDSDGDGIPDACDPCAGVSDDCDGNGIGDACDVAHLARYESFGDADSILYSINGEAQLAASAVLLTDGVTPSQQGSVVFEPVSPLPVSSFDAELWFRNAATGGGSGADGFSICIFDADQHGSGVVFTEEGLSANSISILFDTYKNGADINGNHIELRYNGQSLGVVTPPFTIEDGLWRQAKIQLANGALSLSIEHNGQVVATPFQSVALPGFQPFVARYGVGARCGGVLSETSVDQVLFRDLSGLLGPDEDGNGQPDACLPGSHSIRVGTPPNANALLPEGDSGPTIASTYAPRIDHTSFLPNAQADYLFVTTASTNLSLPPFGTLLVSQPLVLTQQVPAGQPFQVPIPPSGNLLQVPLYMQGFSVDLAGIGGPDLQLTNAIDCVIGGWKASL